MGKQIRAIHHLHSSPRHEGKGKSYHADPLVKTQAVDQVIIEAASFLSSWFSLFLSERCDSPLKGTSEMLGAGLTIQQQDLGNRAKLVEVGLDP